jgi:hypothetical protein
MLKYKKYFQKFNPKKLSHSCGRKAGRGERLMSATVKQRKTGAGECNLETRGGSPCPEVKAANEITCDYVWDKLYPPISVTCSKWYVRKAPLFLGSAFGLQSAQLLPACLTNLPPESFGALAVSV